LALDGVRYVKRKSGICIWEAVGTLLQSSEVELSKFTSFIILTSRLRGPYLPAYVEVSSMAEKGKKGSQSGRMT
jgi:hypothetical protein